MIENFSFFNTLKLSSVLPMTVPEAFHSFTVITGVFLGSLNHLLQSCHMGHFLKVAFCASYYIS